MQLPLFPLKVVLFPGTLLPVHIFEPRYRQLLTDVSAGDHRFGLLPPGADSDQPAALSIGCVAMVRAVQALPQGRSNIVVSGERRFRLVEMLWSQTPYYQGRVEWVEDVPDVQVPTESEVQELRSLGRRYALALHALADQSLDVDLPEAPAELSFGIGALMEWDFDARQRFLEVRSATERVERLLHALPVLVKQAEERVLIHDSAKRNGHGAVS